MIELCAAYGCPLLGALGSGGKWYCACHFNADPNLNDAITAEINRRPETRDRILMARREFRASGEAEAELINAVRDATGQQNLPLEDRK